MLTHFYRLVFGLLQLASPCCLEQCWQRLGGCIISSTTLNSRNGYVCIYISSSPCLSHDVRVHGEGWERGYIYMYHNIIHLKNSSPASLTSSQWKTGCCFSLWVSLLPWMWCFLLLSQWICGGSNWVGNSWLLMWALALISQAIKKTILNFLTHKTIRCLHSYD